MVMADAPSLYPEATERSTPPGRGQHGYYKRRSDGWIITAGAWPQARNDKEFKGFDYLPQFGNWLMGYGDNEEESNQRDRAGRKFFPHKEPWRLIFQHPDGAAAFPVAQIVAYRWHLRPPYREVVLRKLEGITIYDYACPECDKGIFSSDHEPEAVEMLRIHLTSNINSQHAYRPEDMRALGQEFGIDFFAPRRARGTVRVASVDVAAAAVPVLTANIEAKKECPECHELFALAHFEFARHMKTHKKEAVPV